MAKVYYGIDADMAAWIECQPVFSSRPHHWRRRAWTGCPASADRRKRL
jgi:hypothetical protein